MSDYPVPVEPVNQEELLQAAQEPAQKPEAKVEEKPAELEPREARPARLVSDEVGTSEDSVLKQVQEQIAEIRRRVEELARKSEPLEQNPVLENPDYPEQEEEEEIWLFRAIGIGGEA